MKLVSTKMVGQQKSPPPFLCCYWIRDPGWIKIRIRNKHPGSATLLIMDVCRLKMEPWRIYSITLQTNSRRFPVLWVRSWIRIQIPIEVKSCIRFRLRFKWKAGSRSVLKWHADQQPCNFYTKLTWLTTAFSTTQLAAFWQMTQLRAI